jgi:hypothetical protein
LKTAKHLLKEFFRKALLILNIDEKKAKLLKQYSKRRGPSIRKTIEEIIDKIISNDLNEAVK